MLFEPANRVDRELDRQPFTTQITMNKRMAGAAERQHVAKFFTTKPFIGMMMQLRPGVPATHAIGRQSRGVVSLLEILPMGRSDVLAVSAKAETLVTFHKVS